MKLRNGKRFDRILLNDRDLDDACRDIRAMATPIQVIAQEWREERSDAYNRYLFGVAYPAIKDVTGEEVNDLHEYCLGEHFGWVDKKVPKSPKFPLGIEKVPYRTTTTGPDGRRDVLPTEDFNRFVKHTVEPLAARMSAYIAEEWRAPDAPDQKPA